MTDDIKCPICGSRTTLRTAKKGPDAGKKFHVCNRYPDCTGRIINREVTEYCGDNLHERDLSYVLVLKKNGKVNDDFNQLVKTILKKFEDRGCTTDSYTKEIEKRYSDLLIQSKGDPFTLFYFPVEPQKSKEGKLLFDLAKKDIQLLIARTLKYAKDYEFFNTVNYKLTNEEKNMPVDLGKIVLELYQQTAHLRMNMKSPDGDLTKYIQAANKSFGKSKGIHWYVVLKLSYLFPELNEDFYRNISGLSNYLKQNELKADIWNINDIKRRYFDAVSDVKRDLLQSAHTEPVFDVLRKRQSESYVKQFMDVFLTECPRVYCFLVSCLSKEFEEFEVIQNELIEKINIPNCNLDYDIVLTTDPFSGSSYGCFIQFKLNEMTESKVLEVLSKTDSLNKS